MTDLEKSSRIWEMAPSAMAQAMDLHDHLIEESVAAFGGRVIRAHGEGDSAFAVFETARPALLAALEIQNGLASREWPTPEPLRVRMGIHTGAALERGGDFQGPVINRCARIRALAAGGQVLLSGTCYDAAQAEFSLRSSVELQFSDLGRHRLKDLEEPVHLFELVQPGLSGSFPPIRSLGSMPTNLPCQVGRFVGREADIQELRRLLADRRLVTLFGPGGSGKTRLALQAGAELLDRFAEGVWFVDLSFVTEPEHVAATIARVLRSPVDPSRDAVEALREIIADRPMLLILDNCEHVVQPCAELLDRLLRATPELRVLCTSREALNILGEAVLAVPSLPVPARRREASSAVSALLEYPAVRLFEERARDTVPQFEVTPANAPAVVSICRMLDGLPLAIELAAARVRTLSPEQIAARLGNALRLLTGGRRGAPGRQQTLRGALDWSHDLLSPEERVLFRRLAVFRAGWDLEAAEAVCILPGEDLDLLDLLDRLVARALVQADTGAAEARYRLLETVRQYALERLADSGEAQALSEQHERWFLAQAEEAGRQLRGAEQGRWLVRLEPDHANFCAALDHSLDTAQSRERSLEFVIGLFWFWYLRGFLIEGYGYTRRVLTATSLVESSQRARALVCAGFLCRELRSGEAQEYFQESRVLSQRLGDAAVRAQAANGLALLERERGRLDLARELWEETLEQYRLAGDARAIASTLNNLGTMLKDAGRLEAAEPYLAEALNCAREANLTWLQACILANLAQLRRQSGQYEAAAEGLLAASRMAAGINVRTHLPGWISGCAAALMEIGDTGGARGTNEAARLMGFADGLAAAQEGSSENLEHRLVPEWELVRETWSAAYASGHDDGLHERMERL